MCRLSFIFQLPRHTKLQPPLTHSLHPSPGLHRRHTRVHHREVAPLAPVGEGGQVFAQGGRRVAGRGLGQAATGGERLRGR